jgi:triphosphatase
LPVDAAMRHPYARRAILARRRFEQRPEPLMETLPGRAAVVPAQHQAAAPGQRRPLLLSLAPAAVAGLRRHPLLRQAARRSGVTRRTVRRFFDTAALALGGRGFAVGILEIGRRRRQLVRDLRDDLPADALWAHGDAPLAGERPDPAALAAIAPALGPLLAGAELAEIFSVETRRTVWSLEIEGASATLALDVGRLITPNAAEPFADLALLHDGGSAAALYQFVRDVGATLPFAIETRTVERRAYAMLRGEADAPRRAAPIPFPPGASVADGFAAILCAAAALVHDNLRAARAGQPEGVHQLRVALRRLRTTLGVFAPALPEFERRLFAELLAEAAGRLAPLRALDVFLAETAAAMRRELPEERSLRRLEAAAEARRAAAYAAIVEAVVATPTLLMLAAWADGEIWRDGADAERRAVLEGPLLAFAGAALRRRQRRLKRRGDGESEPSVEALHGLRIEAKRARYTAEAFRSLYRPKRVRRYLAGLEALQDVLGTGNDAAAARQLVAELPLPGRAARAEGLLAGWTACEIARGRHAFAAAWREFRDVEPFWRD